MIVEIRVVWFRRLIVSRFIFFLKMILSYITKLSLKEITLIIMGEIFI